jgi:hypothetical protein
MLQQLTAFFTATVFCGFLALEAHAHVAWGIVLDARGQVYFADVLHGGVVWKIDAQGTRSPFVTGKHSHGLVMDDSGNSTSKAENRAAVFAAPFRTLAPPPQIRRVESGRAPAQSLVQRRWMPIAQTE